jgi:diguanylate cyclase (GGDEF)-like protein
MLDIDHFKTVNDTYGHDVGDYVLKATVNVIKRNIRKADIFARYGGEEFMIVQPETTIERAKVYAEKIRTIIEQNNFDKVKKITISIGVTMFNKNDAIESITKRVDDALYRAKDNGRNRVEAA